MLDSAGEAMENSAGQGNANPWQGLLPAERRRFLLALLALTIAVFLLAFSNVAANHSPRPYSLPIGVVGRPAVVRSVSDQLAHGEPGGYAVKGYGTLTDAKTAILHRSIYGAFQPGPPPVILVANAASPPVATLLQKTFTPAALRSGQGHFTLQDVAPLPPWDSTGATSSSGVLAIVIAGLAGASLVYLITRRASALARLLAISYIAIAGGFAFVLATNVTVGAFRGPPSQFFALWGVAALFIVAIGMPIAAFQAAFGVAGMLIGFLLFLVIGSPASGGSSAPELLPTFWRWLSQSLPPGAATTSVRDVVYFDGYGSTGTLLVLAAWAIGGAALAVILYSWRSRRAKAGSQA